MFAFFGRTHLLFSLSCLHAMLGQEVKAFSWGNTEMTRSDRDHLRILSICHYILGGLCIFFGCFFFIYLVFGAVIVNGVLPNNGPPGGPQPEMMGWVFIGFASLMIALYWSIGLMFIQAGDCLRKRKWRTFCLVAAGIGCLMQPLGTVLGVFTFIVLLRPSVRAAFQPVEEKSPGEELPVADLADPNEHDRYHTN